jgi:serine/threonine-protein kinase
MGLAVSQMGASRITAQLYVVGTNDMVKPFTIDKESVLIGRTDPHTGIFPEIDLTMYDPETKVSRRHARIYRQGEQFLIEDLGSVNGTIVNSVNGGSVRLNTKSPRVLSAGDEVKLGGTTLKFMMV